MILDPSQATSDTTNVPPRGNVPGILNADALRELFPSSPIKQKKRARPVDSKLNSTNNSSHRRQFLQKPTNERITSSYKERAWFQQKIPNSTLVHHDLRYHTFRAALDAAIATAAVGEHVRWIRNNVPLRSMPKATLSNHTKISSFIDVLRRILHARLHAAFFLWHDEVQSDKHSAAVAQFVRSEAVQSLQDIWEHAWQRKRDLSFTKWRLEVAFCRDEEGHAAAANIQRCVRRFQCRHVLFNMRRTRAAIQLQSNYRRHTTSKAFRRSMHAESVRRAVTVIQAAYRRKRSRRTFLNALLVYVQTQAAVVLQRWMRNTIYRSQWLRRRGAKVLAWEAATCIQRTVRAFLARRWFHRIRLYKRVATIQRAWRRSWRLAQGPLQASIAVHLEFIRFGIQTCHATVLQASIRGFLGRRYAAKSQLMKQSARCLQKVWREYVARQRRSKARQERRFRRMLAAHCIQATYKGYRERVLFRLALSTSCVAMYLRASRLESMASQLAFREHFHGAIANSASSAIATTWRRHRLRKVARLEALSAAAVVVQTIYRSQRTQRWFRKYVASVHRSATSIQRMVRSRLARNHAKTHVAAMKKVVEEAKAARWSQAALRVQVAWRKKKGRMSLHLRRRAQEAEAARRMASAKRIQRFLRHTRQRRQNQRSMVVAMVQITQKVAARHAAAKRIQHKFRAYRATRLGKAMLATLKLSRRKRERRQAKQKIIAEYLVDSAAAREQEHALMVKVTSNHNAVQGEKDRKTAEAAAAKAERRRLALLAAETTVRHPPQTPLKNKTAGKKGKGEWVEAWDDATNRKYVYNTKTGESKWSQQLPGVWEKIIDN
ncbi:hypothetical protein H257_04278 [Aphanomyces astaci]|uniref:WW domain-containing protein n=1 Tax=Aphanomyces astaci TaxID=112090 RepID=W4GV49_APHAT|nr:hypothetical protein H257_04278 [Aphanomyces astaci]ETV83580.1 hypothetical protein H257_04278 [Aphanomyces astaci]|eukprot:XP_009827010.1 hypothetical protein H257_04278 [Aphanomyces astaci]